MKYHMPEKEIYKILEKPDQIGQTAFYAAAKYSESIAQEILKISEIKVRVFCGVSVFYKFKNTKSKFRFVTRISFYIQNFLRKIFD